ncbi:multiple epidermal growth factor-like domains protein 10 isoform X2 [Ostrea edulis]|uniref:multiple epidermal growth factor-like domains protein 10 isoform X2 n=1 Tax=Ostrea edulis TaxID=37623 RepID=UPI0024AFD910|nr:multiple epidermal growth factor-like domains protein 10 isoform X2 [Ostrea edulis]
MVVTVCHLFFGVLFIFLTEGLDNLASLNNYKGQASQSSSYLDKWHADNAVDGQSDPGHKESSCSFTKSEEEYQSAWWKLALKSMSNVAYLQIFFRPGTVDRHTGFSVFVFNDTNIKPPNGSKVFTHNPATCPQNVMNVTVNRVTTGVAIFNSNNASLKQYCRDYKTQFASIELCEVYVMGCPAGQFGSLCDMCDIRCLNGQCDAFNGSCIYGCHNPLKTPPGCNVCIDGYYGEFCEQCGHCETPKSCNRENGRCGTCQQHWDMPDCKQCKKGYFGNNCSLECGHCLSGTFCDNITGECPTGCEDQWSGTHCDECNKGYYGENCALECGHCLPGTSCNNITGQCLEGCRDKWKGTKCDECQDGLYGHECNSMCGACNITNPAYVKDSGVCLFGCRPKWKGTNCNVGADLIEDPENKDQDKLLEVLQQWLWY